MAMVILGVIALGCTLLIGFAAHRASLCNVRAVAQVMQEKNPQILLSLLQAVLWMAALTGVLVLAFGLVPQAAAERMPIAWALGGGLLFGIGAAVNGGCSLSTLHRLADGNLGMLGTLSGFVLGVWSWFTFMESGVIATLTPAPSVWLRWPQVAPWLLLPLLGWVATRIVSFWRLALNARAQPLRQILLAPTYHLSVAGALLGLSGGLLYATQGAWSYTNYLRSEVVHIVGGNMAPTMWHGVLVCGLLSGMMISAMQRRTLVWRFPGRLSAWIRHVGGGLLMGAGAAIIPGGNDTLLLSGLPSMTEAAIGAYACMLLGIGATILVLGD